MQRRGKTEKGSKAPTALGTLISPWNAETLREGLPLEGSIDQEWPLSACTRRKEYFELGQACACLPCPLDRVFAIGLVAGRGLPFLRWWLLSLGQDRGFRSWE